MALCSRVQLSNVRHLHRLYNTQNGWWSANKRKWWNTTAFRSRLLLAGGAAAATISFFYHNGFESIETILPSAAVNAESVRSSKNRGEKLGSAAVLSRLTSRERRFIQFASTEYRGQLYMTPQDFLESVIEAEPRPRLKRRVLSYDYISELVNKTPGMASGTSRSFRDLQDQGIISYTEYLFLLSILTKPKSGFRIAFNMFDTDGNAVVDKEEFMVLLGILCQSAFKEDSLRGVDRELLEKIFSVAYRERRIRKATDDVSTDVGLQKRGEINTTLLVHLFGRQGRGELNFAEFTTFMENLQTEVLELEFLEFSKGLSTITELDFAKILLRYTQLDLDAYDEYLNRLIESDTEEQGITFAEFRDFGQFLNNLDDFAIAMRMYSLADRSISQDEFQRAVKSCTGAALSPHVVRTVFLLFDADGDGRLSDREFIAIMRDRIHRGLKPDMRNEGWAAFRHCVKQEMKSFI